MWGPLWCLMIAHVLEVLGAVPQCQLCEAASDSRALSLCLRRSWPPGACAPHPQDALPRSQFAVLRRTVVELVLATE